MTIIPTTLSCHAPPVPHITAHGQACKQKFSYKLERIISHGTEIAYTIQHGARASHPKDSIYTMYIYMCVCVFSPGMMGLRRVFVANWNSIRQLSLRAYWSLIKATTIVEFNRPVYSRRVRRYFMSLITVYLGLPHRFPTVFLISLHSFFPRLFSSFSHFLNFSLVFTFGYLLK